MLDWQIRQLDLKLMPDTVCISAEINRLGAFTPSKTNIDFCADLISGTKTPYPQSAVRILPNHTLGNTFGTFLHKHLKQDDHIS